MSQQFVFWRTSEQLDARAVYDALMEGEPVAGLDLLDLDAAEQALIGAFSDWTVEARRADGGEQTILFSPDQRASIDAGYSPESVTVSCSWMSGEQYNLVIQAMATLQLPLYDPQIDERFDSVRL